MNDSEFNVLLKEMVEGILLAFNKFDIMNESVSSLNAGSLYYFVQGVNNKPTYYWPDGSLSSKKPNDGETWTKPNFTGGPTETWQWDDYMGQWINITNHPNGRQTHRQAANQNMSGGWGVSGGYSSGNGTLYIPDDFDMTEVKMDLGRIEQIKCECGSEKCGSNKHSNWCPKYDNT
jgi:hypothetical protein